ncbi:MAG: plastocyanin/azurin family copper-binding protein [Chloroflexota bacterium]
MSRARFLEVGQDKLGRRRFLLAGLTLVGVGALAACGSAGGTASTSSSDGSAATAAARVSSGLNSEAKAAQSVGTAASGQASGGTTVKMTDQNVFDPASVTIAKGGTVTWQNASSTVHSATFDPSKVVNKADVSLPSGVQPFDSGLLQAGQSWSHTFTEAGTYKYTCIPHETLGMHGTVIVQ